MKELSIDEKAKAYDEALAKAVKIHRNYKGRVRAVDVVIEEVFPEFQESEDERIRKKICKLLWDNVPYEEAQEYIAWLEKQVNPTEDELEALRMAAYEPTKNWSEKLQSLYEKLTHCEQKPVIEMKSAEESLGIDSDTYNKIVDECIYSEQKPADVEEVDFFDDFRKTDSEVEPKFHINEWVVTDKNDVVQIKAVNNGYYTIDNGMDFSIPYVDRYWHKWTIQDAKPGDVLVNQNGEMPFIFKECKNNHIYCYCGYTNRKDIFFDRFVDSEGEELHWLNLYHEQAYPATKEQRDLLFQKIHEAGYMWDSASKQLLSLKAEPIDEQKSVWNEEDDKILKSIIINIENLQFSEDMREKYHHIPNANKSYYQIKIDWLKSLKNRVLPQQKQEWNGEDESYYDAIIAKLEVTREDALLTDNEMDFLKSLEGRILPKSTWNEEDITRLKSAITLLQNPLIACDEVNDGIRIKTVDWLKSIESKVLLQSKQEWSKEDEYYRNIILYCLNNESVGKADKENAISWLKSLRPQTTWKPSDAQMASITCAVRKMKESACYDSELVSLLNDLKKLREE